MTKRKYITSGGLAFSEQKDMEKLRRYSLKGWHVKKFKFMGYTLEKGESTDYIYSIDYRSLNKGEDDDYYDFFSSAGWTNVTSEGDIHLFRAHPGTKPIYTDRDTTVSKYENSSRFMNKLAIPLIIMTVLMWLGTVLTSGISHTVFLTIALILTVLAIPTTWTVIATYNNKWKVEEKKGRVNFTRAVPYLLLIIATTTLALGGDKGLIISVLSSTIIGAVAFPTAIWLIMSLYHKVRQN
ncbi:DUF2812 domain-containing protein [Virgibacillus sp. MSJ-26]|uniref:DUF2812 domain-containing protein n=1 Tax=Virgibacillus sp. MSJ-26 TaxID=2841522 RepID=UPI001C10DC9D|nr:DUF2812 domain-containing protein [Virgibacillus sp. MSJ-26]MBU5465521.1 DUF2812 domain-containing protein [Virgibacillus sp. MSJ-26]